MITFAGPSYNLSNYKASAQRSINLFLSPIETADKERFILRSVPGGQVRLSIGAEIRGMLEAAGRVFVVAGGMLYEIDAGITTATPLGALRTSSGRVSMASGLTQLVIADGVGLYVFSLSVNTYTEVGDTDLRCRNSVSFADNYFVLSAYGQQYQITAINDATSIDALDFNTAESSPDGLITHCSLNGEVFLFGARSIEVHFNAGAQDFPFARNGSVYIDTGIAAAGSLCTADQSALFVGRDGNGGGMVYQIRGYQPRRISTLAIEEALRESTDLEGATAYVWSRGGHTFYCLNVPGLDSTYVYDLMTQSWWERCDQDEFGQLTQHAGTAAVYGYGQTIIGTSAGDLLTLDDDLYTWGGDEIVRERISPHDVAPALDTKFFGEFVADVHCGQTALGEQPVVELSWSDDGGATWGNWVARSLGERGQRFGRLRWHRLGRSTDRVWRLRCTDAARFDVLSAVAR